MDAAATCKYYVTKLLRIGPPKPNCVYDVRSGNVRDREHKSLLRVFYRAKGRRRRKHRHRAGAAADVVDGDGGGGGTDGVRPVVESYVSSSHEDEVGARISDGKSGGGGLGGGHALEDDTVEDIEKKFLGFRNVFEKCKVKKKKKPPRLFNVTSGLRFTLVANTMLHMDDQKKASDGGGETTTSAATGADGAVVAAEPGAIREEGERGGEEVEEGDGEEEDGDEEDEEEEEEVGGGDSGDDGADDDDEDGSIYEDVLDVRPVIITDSDANDNGVMTTGFCSKTCPKDVVDKVNSWIDSSAKQTEYSEEESVIVGEENIQPRDAVLKCGDRLHIVKGRRHSNEGIQGN